jgi:glycopeptide antibiotics resistance protein
LTQYYSQQIQVSMITAIAFLVVATTFRYVAFFLQRRRLGTNGFWAIMAIGSLAVIFTFTLARLGVRSHEIRQIVLVPFAGGEYANVNSRLALVKIFGNIALFAPLGFSLQFMFRRNLSSRMRHDRIKRSVQAPLSPVG